MGTLHEHTRLRAGRVHLTAGSIVVRDRDHHLDITLDEDPATAFEVVTPIGRGRSWTRKQAIRARGAAIVHVVVGGHRGPRRRPARHLERHRRPQRSATRHREHTVWIDGHPTAVGPVVFACDLSSVIFDDGSQLFFTQESERASAVDLLVIRSAYRQPFGTFTGTLTITQASG